MSWLIDYFLALGAYFWRSASRAKKQTTAAAAAAAAASAADDAAGCADQPSPADSLLPVTEQDCDVLDIVAYDQAQELYTVVWKDGSVSLCHPADVAGSIRAALAIHEHDINSMPEVLRLPASKALPLDVDSMSIIELPDFEILSAGDRFAHQHSLMQTVLAAATAWKDVVTQPELDNPSLEKELAAAVSIHIRQLLAKAEEGRTWTGPEAFERLLELFTPGTALTATDIAEQLRILRVWGKEALPAALFLDPSQFTRLASDWPPTGQLARVSNLAGTHVLLTCFHPNPSDANGVGHWTLLLIVFPLHNQQFRVQLYDSLAGPVQDSHRHVLQQLQKLWKSLFPRPSTCLQGLTKPKRMITTPLQSAGDNTCGLWVLFFARAILLGVPDVAVPDPEHTMRLMRTTVVIDGLFPQGGKEVVNVQRFINKMLFHTDEVSEMLLSAWRLQVIKNDFCIIVLQFQIIFCDLQFQNYSF